MNQINQQQFIYGEPKGKGHFGKVFEGINNVTGEKVAIKVMNICQLIEENVFDKIQREFDCMKKCECENSVKLFDVIYYPKEIHMIIELCDIDLNKLLYEHHNNVPFTVEEIRDLFLKLNNGFKVLRKNNIVHRDLKPDNIMIKYTKDKTGIIPKISDYGLSKVLLSEYNNTMAPSCQWYMAPELINGTKYNEKVDLWSIGCIMYELYTKKRYYNEIYYGKNIRDILNYYYGNNRRNNLELNFYDLLVKLLENYPERRISWNEYFYHPFFANEKRYVKLYEINLGFKYDKENDLFQCYVAKDNKYNMNVIIKSYKKEFVEKNKFVFDIEIELLYKFCYNSNVLKFIKVMEDNDRINLVFEYKDFITLKDYIQQQNSLKEKEIKKFNQKLYYNVFIFLENNYIRPFSFISLYTFGINKNYGPIILDFGLHQFLIPHEEYCSYYLNNLNEIKNYVTSYKTNVLNYGIVLLKLYCGDKNKFEIKGKELVLPKNVVLSDKFNSFVSKCLYRNINKRYSWSYLEREPFLWDNDNGISMVIDSKNVLIDDDKLAIIFDSLKNKFKMINDYYKNIDLSKSQQYINSIDIFIIITLFEMKLALNIFNRNFFQKPFTNQEEISFISINNNCDINKLSLNLNNPLLTDIKIFNMRNNKLIQDFVYDLKNTIKSLEETSKKIKSYSKSNVGYQNLNNLIKELLKNLDDEYLQNYFYSIVINKLDKGINNLEKYNELCIGEYLCELFIFLKAFLYEDENFIFNKENLMNKFSEIFGKEKNKIEISVIKLKETNNIYTLLSFIPILFKNYKYKEKMQNHLLEMDKHSLDGVIRYYPHLMKSIIDLKVK